MMVGYFSGPLLLSGDSIWLWNWQRSILIGLAALTAGYLLFSRFRRSTPWPRQLAFHLGTLLIRPLPAGLAAVLPAPAHPGIGDVAAAPPARLRAGTTRHALRL